MNFKIKSIFCVVCLMVITLSYAQPVYANMAAPLQADLGSGITFEKNDKIAVVSEFLDIAVDGAYADITATYRMKNTTDENITTPSMFLSPNIEYSGVSVIVNETAAEFTVDSQILHYSIEVEADDWRYAIVMDDYATESNSGQSVDTITFNMEFAPQEEYDVVVSYRYRLGGYPEYDYSAKRGEIEYYLAPAAMWNDFSSITIMLHLDENMPVITDSNIDFKKVDARTYQYTSDSLPQGMLRVVIDENWWQNIFSTLRNPYMLIFLPILAPVVIAVLAIVIFIVVRIRRKNKVNDQKDNTTLRL